MENKNYCIHELSLMEQKEINGGNPLIAFIAGAILGGALYDLWKAGCKEAIRVQVEHPEYYDGAVHSQR
jgi:hypothetical protein